MLKAGTCLFSMPVLWDRLAWRSRKEERYTVLLLPLSNIPAPHLLPVSASRVVCGAAFWCFARNTPNYLGITANHGLVRLEDRLPIAFSVFCCTFVCARFILHLPAPYALPRLVYYTAPCTPANTRFRYLYLRQEISKAGLAAGGLQASFLSFFTTTFAAAWWTARRRRAAAATRRQLLFFFFFFSVGGFAPVPTRYSAAGCYLRGTNTVLWWHAATLCSGRMHAGMACRTEGLLSFM